MTASATHMSHFGESLRCERQRRSVTLEDIAHTTKVTVRSLQALESEAFDQLPGGILSKGIVRSYVRCLGLDEAEWVDRFLEASGQKSEPAAPVPDRGWVAFALNVSSQRRTASNDFRLRWVGVALILLLLASFGWLVWGYVHQRVTTAQKQAQAQSVSSLHSAAASYAASSLPFPAGIRKS